MSTPTTPQTTYFGDVNVYGNTTMSGTLAVLGTPALFRSNLGVVTDGTSGIGTDGTRFQYAWTTAANTTSVNLLTNIPGPIGVATTTRGSTVTVLGNVLISNTISSTNVNTVTINTGSVMNVNFMTGPGGIGIGTNVTGGARLAVLGTMNAVTSFQVANLVLSGTLNVFRANIFSIGTSNIGIGTTPASGGAPLAVQGFATISNALQTTNVYVTTANVVTLNTGALVSSSGFVGVGTSDASGTTMLVAGDLGSSNSINAPIMTASGLIASGRINVATLVAQSNVGIGGAPDQGGATLEVMGNVFLSNTFTTPQVFAGSMNVANRSNIVTGLATSNVLIGPDADQYIGFNLAVDGNVIVSNALQTTGMTADSLVNVATTANLLAIMSPFSLGVSNPINGAGAFFSLDSTYDDTAVVPSYTTAPTVLSGTPTFISGVGPAGQDVLNTPIASVRWTATTLVSASRGFSIAGWVYLNVLPSSAKGGLFEVYTSPPGNFWWVGLNLRSAGANYNWEVQFRRAGVGASNITNAAIPVAGTWYHVAITITTGRLMTLYVNGAVLGTTTVATAGSWPPTGEGDPQYFYVGDFPDGTGNQASARFSGMGVYPSVFSAGQISALYSSGTFSMPATAQYGISGNFYASNTLTIFTANAFMANVARSLNLASVTARTSVGINTTADVTGATRLFVQGNAFISNALTLTSVYATTSANTVTLNTSSVSTWFLGISTNAPSGTSLYIPGNVFASNALTTSNMTVTKSNALVSNAMTIYASSNVGIGTAPVAGGANLAVQGNAFVSNALTSANVYATTSANTATLNTGPIFSTFLGVGTSVPSGTTLYITGNVAVSNAVRTNITATLMNVASRANTTNFTMDTGQFVGIGTTPTGNALEVSGNAFVSNTITATNVFSTLSNIRTLNTLSIFTRNSFLGIGTSAASNTTMFVTGNVYASTSIGAQAIFPPAQNASLITGNAVTVTTGTANIGSNIGATLTVTGNLWASNSVASTNIVATSANITGVSNVTSLVPISNLAVGTASGVRGNVIVSNSITTTNVFVTSVTTATMNTLSITAPVGVSLTGYSGPWGYVPFNGTLVDSIGNLTNPVVTGTLTYTTTNGPGGGPTLVAAPSSYPKWTMSSLINVDDGLTVSLWVRFNTAYSATQDIFSGQTFYNQGLNFAISGSKLQLNFWTKPVPVRSIINTTITPVVGAWYNLACTINKSKLIVFYVNGVSVGSATYVNSGTTMGPSVWLNGPSGLSTGEVEYTDLQIYTADLTAGEILTIYNLNAVRPLAGYAIRVLNNLYASNAITTVGNISGILMNLTSTLNTGSFTTALIVADELGWSNTDIYISNSITTANVYTTNVNAASYVGTSGSIGIGTADGGYALKIQGNLASSNTLWSLPDVSALQSIYYVDDFTKRAPHLRPTPSNAASIQSWISATCNAASQPTEGWWSVSSLPVSSNAVSLSTALIDTWIYPLLLPDGRVLIVPDDYSNVGFFNPYTNEFSTVAVRGMPPATSKWRGGVLTPNGSVVFIPQAQSNVGVFNPISYNYSNISAGLKSSSTLWFQGGVLAPDGNVICVPRDSPNICVVNPILFTSSNVGPIAASGLDLFGSGVLLPNGNVVFTPVFSANIGMFNPTNRTYSNVGPVKPTGTVSSSGPSCLAPDGNVIMLPYNSGNVIVYNPSFVSSPLPARAFSNIIVSAAGGSKFNGAALVPSGNIICVPYSSDNIGMIDPVALTYSNATAYNGPICRGGVLIPDGRIVSPRADANIIHTIGGFGPASVEFCLSPYFNKF